VHYGVAVDRELEERLGDWTAAGIIDPLTARTIAAYEAARPAPAQAPPQLPPPPPSRGVSPAEVITYIGVAVILAGILFEVFNGLQSGAAGPVLLVFAAAAAVLGAVLRPGQAPSSRRAAGAALATAAGLAAVGVGELLVASGAFTTLELQQFLDQAGNPVYKPAQNIPALTAIAGAVCLLLSLLVLALVPVTVGALLTAAATYATAMGTAAAIGGESATGTGIAPLVAGVVLVLLSASRVFGPAGRALGVCAALFTPPLLLVVGAIHDSPTGLLIVVAGAVAALSMIGAVRLTSNGLAVAGGLGVFGVSLDVAGRAFDFKGGAAPALIITGLLLVACAALTQQAVRINRRRRLS